MAGFDLGNTLAGVLDTVPATGAAARTPEIIGAEIRSLTAASNYTTLFFAVEIGRRLTEAKEMVGHGGWLIFLKEHTEFSESTAKNLMQVYRAYGDPQGNLFGTEISNRQTFGDLTYTKALALLALPEEERADFVTEVDVDAMSTRELKEAIRERDEARQALDTALADVKKAEEAAAQFSADKGAAEEKVGKLEADLALAQNTLESAQKAAADALANADSLRKKVKELEARPVDVAVMSVDQEALDKARADAVAEMQGKLDRAKKKTAKAEEKRKAAEDALAEANEKLESARRAEVQAVISNNKELANFELLFQQAQEKVNAMHGMLLKVRGRGDEALTEKLQKALLALSDAVRRCAE